MAVLYVADNGDTFPALEDLKDRLIILSGWRSKYTQFLSS
jgi:hypothetical protein